MSDLDALALDQAHRTFAAERIDVSAFLAAGAGTGKTSTLVSRVMHTLKGGVPIEAIVAITFTERAGAELRHRLRNELNRQRVLPDALPCMQEAYEHLDSASVGTIHAFARRILSRFALEAGLPMGFTVADEVATGAARRQRVRDAVERLNDSADAGVLRAYGVQVSDLRSIVSAIDSAMLRLDDGILTDSHRREVEARPEAARQAVDAFMHDAQATCSDPDDKLLLLLQERAADLRDFLDTTDLDVLIAALPDNPKTKFRFFSLGNAGSAKVWGDPKAVRDAWSALEEYVRLVICGPLELALRGYADAARAELVGAREARRREGSLEFDDLLWLAADVLDHEREVRARLHDEIKVMLIDEFQDTDPLQWRIIRRITAHPDDDNANPLAGRIVVVGDPKQAIYSFRGADIGTYNQALAMFEPADGIGEVLQLRQNFRTVAPVIHWVNQLFTNAMAPTDEVRDQVPYEALLPKHDPSHTGPGPAVTILRDPPEWVGADEVPMKPADIEARLVARSIATAVAEGWQITRPDDNYNRYYAGPARYKDIAILMPTRTALPNLLNQLDAAAIPYRSSDIALVFDRPVVLGVIAALRAIADPQDQLQLWLTLKSPLFGCVEGEMLRFVAAGGRWNTTPKPELLDNRVGAAIAGLRTIGRQLRTGQPVDVIDAVFTDTRIFEVLAHTPRGTFDADCLRMLRAHAQQWQNAGGVGIADYNEALAAMVDEGSRAQLPSPDDTIDDAVQLLTVHAAKGLEFPIVVMTGMTSKRYDGAQSVQVQDGEVEFSLTGRLHTAGFKAFTERRYSIAEAERMRVLYVAATRARDHLIVSTCGESGSTSTSAAALLRPHLPEAHLVIDDVSAVPRQTPEEHVPVEPVAAEWLEAIPTVRERSAADFVATPSRAEAPQALGITPSATVVEAEPEATTTDMDDATGRMTMALRDGKSYGQAVHAAMDAVISGRVTMDEQGLHQAAEAGLAAADGEADRDEVITSVRAALKSPIVAEALSSNRRWSELYLAAPVASGTITLVEGIADLVFERADGSVVVVDYKTDEAIKPETRAHYADQLACYAELLQRATGKAVTRKVIVHVPGGSATEFDV